MARFENYRQFESRKYFILKPLGCIYFSLECYAILYVVFQDIYRIRNKKMFYNLYILYLYFFYFVDAISNN